MRGDGRIYSRARSPYLWMEFWRDGRAIRKSTGKTTEQEARAVLDSERRAVKDGDRVPGEERVTLRDLFRLLDADYQRKRRRSISTMRCSFQHFIAFFGEKAKAIRLGERLDDYEAHRKEEGASVGTLRIELSLLHRAYHLAVKKKRLSARSLPDIELPPPDHTAVRKGFFRRATVERLCERLPNTIADVVLFLFFCPWRVGAARRLEWRDYDPQDQVLTLRPELNKTGHELRIPVDPENTPELMAVIERQAERRRAECPFIFHGSQCGTARLNKHGQHRPCLGDFQKSWDRACAAIGMAGRIPHDLRRSGVKHYIEAGVDPHIVMAWSGHRTRSMLDRYHIIDLDDLRRAGKLASSYRGPKENVSRPAFGQRTRTPPAHSVETGAAPGRRG